MNLFEKKSKRAVVLYGIASLLVLAVIYSQSLFTREASGNLSGFVLRVLKPLLDPNDRIDHDLFHFWIRKSAHFIEFSALGLCLGGFSVHLGILRNRRYIALPMLLGLGVAVSDEYLQYFTGRGSMVTDVVLDYAGALTGLLLAWLFFLIRRNGKKAKKHES